MTFKQLERTNSDEDNKTFHDGKKKNPKVRDEDRMFVNLGLIDLVNVKNDALMKIIKPRQGNDDLLFRNILSNIIF